MEQSQKNSKDQSGGIINHPIVRLYALAPCYMAIGCNFASMMKNMFETNTQQVFISCSLTIVSCVVTNAIAKALGYDDQNGRWRK